MKIKNHIPSGSRAVLIGVSEYLDRESFPCYPAVANSVYAMRDALVDPGLCGWPPNQVELILNPTSSGALTNHLRSVAANTTGVLFFYYVGHGVLTEDGDICLTVQDTEAVNPDTTGLEYAKLRRIFYSGTPARTRIAFLDSCYSGRVIGLSGMGNQIAEMTAVDGTYTLTAADDIAHVVPLAEQSNACTSFTGELIDLIRSGINGGPPYLTLSEMYPHLRQRLIAKSLPCPNQRGTDNALQFSFTSNATAVAPPARNLSVTQLWMVGSLRRGYHPSLSSEI